MQKDDYDDVCNNGKPIHSEVYEEQRHIYNNYKPMDKKTLATYPTILEDMATIDGVCPANNDEDRLKPFES